MLRRLHTLPGLLAALVLCVCAVSGAILALEPPLDRLQSWSVESREPTVAEVADRLVRRNDAIERIVRGPDGTLAVDQRVSAEVVAFRAEPRTGGLLERREPSAWLDFTRRLHRSLLLGDGGRGAVGISAAAMLLLSVSGLVLLARRLGGWGALLRPIRGTTRSRWHCEVARAASLGLLLSAATGCVLSLFTFEILPDPAAQAELAPPPGFSNVRPRFVPLARMHELQAVPFSQLRERVFPRDGEPAVIRLVTAGSTSLLDRASGALIASEPLGTGAKVYEWVYSLHTGQGLWPLAIVLGLSAVTVPILAGTGTAIWWRRRREIPRVRSNVSAQSADTILLVGSEGGTTWRHASALHASLTSTGHKVHTAPMNALARKYARARRIIILTSTYGDGTAPASARQFLARLERLETKARVAVLGFGDRSFRHYCQYARDVSAALAAQGHVELLPLALIDRQSTRDLDAWTTRLGHGLGVQIAVKVDAAKPKTIRLKLIERTIYGEEVQAPTAILRFAPDDAANISRWLPWPLGRRARLQKFLPGDLVGILPGGTATARFYSLGSSSEDGMLEICVRKQPGGVCSTVLHDLQLGQSVEAFVKSNPAFRPGKGRKPLLLIGAGAGIAPLAGMVRGNRAGRAIHLYWGGRHPDSDFLYEGDLSYYLADRRLSRMRPIFSRSKGGGYVQDRLAEDANVLRDLVRNGAQIMVCGSSPMAAAVAATIDRVVAPMGLDLMTLKERGRYVEDVY